MTLVCSNLTNDYLLTECSKRLVGISVLWRSDVLQEEAPTRNDAVLAFVPALICTHASSNRKKKHLLDAITCPQDPTFRVATESAATATASSAVTLCGLAPVVPAATFDGG